EGVEARAAVVFGGAPGAFDPAALLEALEGGVEGAVVDEEGFAGAALDGECDAMAVVRRGGKDAQDEEVEGSLEEGIAGGLVSGRHSTRVFSRLGRMSTRATPERSVA